MVNQYPKCLRVMADYGSSGIWVVEPIGPFRHGMIKHRALDLSDQLACEFRNWIEQYWKVLDAPDDFNSVTFNAEGRRLARQLKAHVGCDTKVLFAPIRPDNSLDIEEEIK